MGMRHLLAADGSDILLGRGVSPNCGEAQDCDPSVSCAVELRVWLGPTLCLLVGKIEGNVACSIMAGRGWTQRLSASNFTLFLGKGLQPEVLEEAQAPSS